MILPHSLSIARAGSNRSCYLLAALGTTSVRVAWALYKSLPPAGGMTLASQSSRSAVSLVQRSARGRSGRAVPRLGYWIITHRHATCATCAARLDALDHPKGFSLDESFDYVLLRTYFIQHCFYDFTVMRFDSSRHNVKAPFRAAALLL